MPDPVRNFTPDVSVPFQSLSRPVRQSLIWQGTRLGVPSALRPSAASGGLSVLVSNRTLWDQTADHPDGLLPEVTGPLGHDDGACTLNWYRSTVSDNDPDVAHYLSSGPVRSATVPDDLRRSILGLLNDQASPSITVFVHGLGTLFTDAVKGSAAVGLGLRNAGYDGVVMGFDWPSYDGLFSGIRYSKKPYAFPPSQTDDSIRGNINGSVAAFRLLIDFLSGLRSDVSGLTVSLVCHSEGNYMAMLGLDGCTSRIFDHVLLLAADINDGALLSPADPTAHVGQGQGLCRSAADVTVYWTGWDELLHSSADLFREYHNPAYPKRLGHSGPSGRQSDQSGNVYSVDCTAVLDPTNVRGWVEQDVIPAQRSTWSDIHVSYLYVPQVLSDMAQVIMGASQGGIGERARVPGSDQWFTMDAPVFAEGGDAPASG